MGNPLRGSVTFEAAGKTWTLRFAINEICALEAALDLGVNEIAVRMSNPAKMRLTMARTAFWAGLSELHPDITHAQAGELMTELGPARAIELIGEAFAKAFPEVEAGTSGPPRKGARAGTGSRS